jgi:hypothetical protein
VLVSGKHVITIRYYVAGIGNLWEMLRKKGVELVRRLREVQTVRYWNWAARTIMTWTTMDRVSGRNGENGGLSHQFILGEASTSSAIRSASINSVARRFKWSKRAATGEQGRVRQAHSKLRAVDKQL